MIFSHILRFGLSSHFDRLSATHQLTTYFKFLTQAWGIWIWHFEGLGQGFFSKKNWRIWSVKLTESDTNSKISSFWVFVNLIHQSRSPTMCSSLQSCEHNEAQLTITLCIKHKFVQNLKFVALIVPPHLLVRAIIEWFLRALVTFSGSHLLKVALVDMNRSLAAWHQ
jgi:hypothetical protein